MLLYRGMKRQQKQAAPGSKIFLKMPKPRLGLLDYLKFFIYFLLFLIFCLVLALLWRDYAPLLRQDDETSTASELVETSAAPGPDDLVPAEMLSCRDPDLQRELDRFFGPLPQTYRDRSYERHPVRGIYCRTPDPQLLERFIDLAKRTEINALIIDAKESYGLTYPSQVPLAVEIGAAVGNLNWQEICERCHAEGILVIARVVVFKDETMVHGKPELCIQNARGQVCTYGMEGGASFVNPYRQEAWQYIIDISKELIHFGVDEIQFDYIRFPTGAPDGDLLPSSRETAMKTPSLSGTGRSIAFSRPLESNSKTSSRCPSAPTSLPPSWSRTSTASSSGSTGRRSVSPRSTTSGSWSIPHTLQMILIITQAMERAHKLGTHSLPNQT